jgi:hypothetical protein
MAVLPKPDPNPALTAEERPQLVFFHSPMEGRKLRRRIVAPHGCREIEDDLEPWLR